MSASTSTATAKSPTENPKADKPAAKPVASAQYGTIRVAVFPREVKRDDGTTFTAFDFNVRRSYKKADGTWDDTSMSLNRRDVFSVIQALTDCHKESYTADSGQESTGDG